jgi:hypothetical protein
MIKIISILLLITPLFNLLFLYIFKSKYKGYVIKIIHLTIFVTSLFLMLMKIDSSFMFFICNLIALLLLVIVEKAYNVILNRVLATLISQLTNTNVISTVFITSKNIFALTTKGYVMVNYKTSDYKIHKDIQEFSKSEQIILNSLNSLKFKESRAK